MGDSLRHEQNSVRPADWSEAEIPSGWRSRREKNLLIFIKLENLRQSAGYPCYVALDDQKILFRLSPLINLKILFEKLRNIFNS